MLEEGKAMSPREIAEKERVDNSYVSRMMNLTLFAPDIVVTILDDQLPVGIWRFDLAVDMPVGWEEPEGKFDVRSVTRLCRVEMWRGGVRFGLAVTAPFVWRCLSSRTLTPFPHPAHRTGQADFPHPALGQDITPSPTTGRTQAESSVRDPRSHRGTKVDNPRPYAA